MHTISYFQIIMLDYFERFYRGRPNQGSAKAGHLGRKKALTQPRPSKKSGPGGPAPAKFFSLPIPGPNIAESFFLNSAILGIFGDIGTFDDVKMRERSK